MAVKKKEKDKEKLTFIDKYKILTEDGIDLEKRIIYLFGELNEDLGTILRTKYAALKLYWQEELETTFNDFTIDVNSYGGSIYSINAALDFYDEVYRLDKTLVNTRASGVCMSAATIILAGGTGKRTASKRTRFMFHDIQTGGVEGTATQVVQYAKDLRQEQKDFFGFYAQIYFNKNKIEYNDDLYKKEVKKWQKRFTNKGVDHYLPVTEVLKLNLIDEIV